MATTTSHESAPSQESREHGDLMRLKSLIGCPSEGTLTMDTLFGLHDFNQNTSIPKRARK
jgi:hypothetical protein